MITFALFVTGRERSHRLGSVPKLIRSGHEVVGLARSDTAAATVSGRGAAVCRGDLGDLDGIRQPAAEADGSFISHCLTAGRCARRNIGDAAATQRAVLDAFGDALAGTGKPLVTTSALGALGPLGRPITEQDQGTPGGPIGSEIAAVDLAERGMRSVVVR